MRAKILNAKYSNYDGYYFEKKIPINIEDENYLEHAVPFKFGFVNEDNKENVRSNIRTFGSSFIIQTFRDIEFKVGDRVLFDGKVYDIENVNVRFNHSTKKIVKQYYITLR